MQKKYKTGDGAGKFWEKMRKLGYHAHLVWKSPYWVVNYTKPVVQKKSVKGK